MNILHIYSSFESSQGGPPVSIKYLAMSQVLSGHKVTILTYFKKKKLNIPGIKIVNIKYFLKRYSIPDIRSLKIIKLHIKKNDIVHLHGMWNGLISVSAFFAKKSKSLITPHGMGVKKNIYNKPIFKKIYHKIFDKFLFKNINGCHYLSLHEYKNTKWILGNKKYCIQHNLIDTQKIKNYINKNRTKKIFDKNFINLVYLGRFNEIKNIDFQIDLVKKIIKKNKKILLHLIGPNNHYKDSLKKKIKKNNLEKYIKLKSPIFSEKKYLFLNQANFVLLTSKYECNSILALETISSGGLLVANKNCNLDLYSKLQTCIISQNNINDFTNKILSYRNMEYKIIRNNAMQYANSNLNFKIKNNLVTMLYKKI